MTTVAVVRKAGYAAIAADSLTSFGDMRLSAAYARDKRKVLRVGDGYLGLSGSTAHYAVLESHFASLEKPPALSGRREIFETWRELHEALKTRYFLNPKDEDSDPYESTQINALMASPHGLFGIYSLREIFQYERFWAMGSGREYALGALAVLYDRLPTARAVAEAAVLAACEFDKGSAPPLESYEVVLEGPREASPTGAPGPTSGS
jgi:ATP-dependent protease HslVU (ClpYQ) peptidase subunit